MHTLWQTGWDWLFGGTTLSVERTMTGRVGDKLDVPFTMVLLVRWWSSPRTQAAYAGLMHRGRRPVGLAVLTGGALRQRWWGS